jgi:hypothetical protein
LFRKYHLTGEIAQQFHCDILTSLEIEASTEPLQNCDCQQGCDCPKHFSDSDVQISWQRPTLTKKDKFVGYRKHTIFAYDADKNHRLPLATAVAPADQADINVIENILEQCY